MPLSLRVTDFNDREILRIIDDVAGSDGWANVEHIAERIFPTAMRRKYEGRTTALRCVATRLSWMKRFGVVRNRVQLDKVEKVKYTQWSLTSSGDQILRGSLTASQTKVLEEADQGRVVAAAEILANRYISLNKTAATMVRRQWQYGDGQRRR